MKKSAIIVSGYFNPLHKGHIEYFHSAKKYADKLIVIVNNDFQRKLKGSKSFMYENERLLITTSESYNAEKNRSIITKGTDTTDTSLYNSSKGAGNPINRKTITKLLNVDSKFRENYSITN